MKDTICIDVDTPNGKATLVKVYLTELGILMAKIYFPKEKVWVNYRTSEVSKILKDAKINILQQ